MRHPYGISPSKECFLPLPNGMFLAFPSVEDNEAGCDYVRIVDKFGGERVFWECNEWAEEPEFVMGAILGACVGQGKDFHDRPPKYYRFAPDCEFPDSVTVEE